jgi:hypothetical protein
MVFILAAKKNSGPAAANRFIHQLAIEMDEMTGRVITHRETAK